MTLLAERLRLLAATGIDAVLVLPFDAALAGLTAQGICAPDPGGCGFESFAAARGRQLPLWARRRAGVAELKEFGARVRVSA